MNFYKNEPYKMNPEEVEFSPRYVEFNPVHNELEYEATKINIEKVGQKDPILLYKGLCVDGRHRVKIAKELGIQVKCVDLVDDISDQDIITMCNINIMSGRDYTPTQKAIQALKLVKDFKYKAVDASKILKVSHKLTSYANSIAKLGREDILKILMQDKAVLINGMKGPSKSLEIVCKYIKAEEENKVIIINNEDRIMFNPEAKIKTEVGKAEYYSLIEEAGIPENAIRTRMALASYVNMVYTLTVEE